MVRSIEEKIEDWAKAQLRGLKLFSKTETINSEIETALQDEPSKKGGTGRNYPDIQLFLQTSDTKPLPVMIEVKGTKGDFIKTTPTGEIENKTSKGEPNYKNISKYAVNGAVHYANAIIKHTTFRNVLAIGVNGYEEGGKILYEIGAYYVSHDNFGIPKYLGDYSDLSFLLPAYREDLTKLLAEIGLTEAEKEEQIKRLETEFEGNLKTLNQKMHDDLGISAGQRVELIVGMIMAGLGVPDKVPPLEVAELQGFQAESNNDGIMIINRITTFLEEKNLPREKKEMIIRNLKNTFVSSEMWKPIHGESKLKTIYTDVKKYVMPSFTSKEKHLDFTGKLFNVLNDWVDVPDGEKNDVVLTPRYVTELMARLAEVNKDSYVWDYAVGSAGFLISSMKLMLQDAQTIQSKELRAQKEVAIKAKQLLGIEKRADIYLLAVLNMILMGDGSSNILHEDSLLEFQGNYEQGEMNGKPFPADVFLLNPPYSAAGKGFVFVEKALSRMTHGRACVLIQENAGSGQGLDYTKRILQHNTLLASIHMADIFCGKAGVQTAIYLFEVGKPHKAERKVKFIDFSNDGYARQNRKKSSSDVNLRDVDNAAARYQEIVDIVLGNAQSTHYYDDCVIEDTITLHGNDWTYAQHKKIDTIPTESDFRKTVKDYLSWKVSTILQEESENFQ